MPDAASKALLPVGLRDVLPPDAGFEAAVSERLLGHFADNGFERVSPPLVEFEDSFLSGAGAALAPATFRLMDPVSQRMLAVRSDLTVQVARIATTRLAGAPRPLRLSYLGQVLRVKGGQLRPERQFRQAGAELIGSAAPAADAEVVLLAAHALGALGINDVTIDLNLPTMVPAVCGELGLAGATLDRLKAALDRKDAKTVSAIAGPEAAPLLALLAASGPADQALARLDAMALPATARAACRVLGEAVALIRLEAPALTLTVDAVENRGFEYHTGTSFSIFAKGVRGELGRGGRYLAQNGAPEPATGFTLYMDMVIGALAPPVPTRRLFLPVGTTIAVRRRFQGDGWVTVLGLEPVADDAVEARRLGCAAVLRSGNAASVGS
ncbi:MAG: ATP phosphoribosyltransferase regulatory subunit [Alphaproteobacteria bacterium]|nr:ATP phosphoribosyltransferase regulatory subunit [Alphaproteobacteria bacterium]